MGYTTEFDGKFTFDKNLDKETFTLLKGLSETRRMKRRIDDVYGVDGEFYVGGEGFYQFENRDDTIVDNNTPPASQPSLWLQWTPTETGRHLEWDGGEKFYNYIEWLEYIIEKVLIPNGYKLNGEVKYYGEETNDKGTITIIDNDITVKSKAGFVYYNDEKISIDKFNQIKKEFVDINL